MRVEEEGTVPVFSPGGWSQGETRIGGNIIIVPEFHKTPGSKLAKSTENVTVWLEGR